MIAKYQFNQFNTDYFQFHLKDAETNETLKDAWTKEALAKNLAVEKHIIGIGTQRNTTAKIIIESFENKPEVDPDTKWRQVLECELNLYSGKLILTCPTLEETAQQHINFMPSIYRLRIYYGDKNQRGSHIYKIHFWQN